MLTVESLTATAIRQAFLWRDRHARCPCCGAVMHGVADVGIVGLSGVAPGQVMPYLACRRCLTSGALSGLIGSSLMGMVDLRVRTMPAEFAFPLSVPPVSAPSFPDGYSTGDAFVAGVQCRAAAHGRNREISELCCAVCDRDIAETEAGFIFGVVRQLHPSIEVMPGLACDSCLHPDADFHAREPVIEAHGWAFRFNPGSVFPAPPTS